MMVDFIRGDTRLVCLFGYPVAHSLSPQIHNHAFRELGLPFAYIPLGIPGRSLPHAVQVLRAAGMVGANVTIPHKEQIVYSCDGLSELSSLTKTVNTLYFRDGALWGDTTDPEGFLRALSWMGHDPKDGSVVILGNGGTARTLGAALAFWNIPATLTLIGRNRLRVGSLAEWITSVTRYPVHYLTFDDPSLKKVLERCSLLVNCTSVGMHPHEGVSPLDSSCFHAGMTVFDSIYNPPKTTFLQYAEAAGCTVQNGLRMLLYQGLASFKLWTGVEPPEELFDLEELQRQIQAKSC